LVSIEPRYESASFGAIPMGIDLDLNVFGAILCPEDRQPPSKFALIYSLIYPSASSRAVKVDCFASLAIMREDPDVSIILTMKVHRQRVAVHTDPRAAADREALEFFKYHHLQLCVTAGTQQWWLLRLFHQLDTFSPRNVQACSCLSHLSLGRNRTRILVLSNEPG
jgi:hypothetical protein